MKNTRDRNSFDGEEEMRTREGARDRRETK